MERVDPELKTEGAQLAVKVINQEHRAAGRFTVELWTWEKISKLIRQYPEIEQQFYGIPDRPYVPTGLR